jgi:hypothetical protein
MPAAREGFVAKKKAPGFLRGSIGELRAIFIEELNPSYELLP